MLRLGVMGGTFDPLHWAHLVMAEESRMAFGLNKVLFIPAGQPPHKMCYHVSDAEHRYAMTILGTVSNPAFEASRIELDREGPSYSVDTIRQLKDLFGSDTELYFILGADEAADLPKWHEADTLPTLARFVVAPRHGLDVPEIKSMLPQHFLEAMGFLPMMPIDISATEIRSRVASGKSIKYLVPDDVEQYIRKNRLYSKGNTI